MTDNIAVLKMNFITFNKLRANYGYEIAMIPKNSGVKNVIGQIKKALIVKDDSLDNFVLIPLARNLYVSSNINNKTRFMTK